jgi:hypothetical protein
MDAVRWVLIRTGSPNATGKTEIRSVVSARKRSANGKCNASPVKSAAMIRPRQRKSNRRRVIRRDTWIAGALFSMFKPARHGLTTEKRERGRLGLLTAGVHRNPCACIGAIRCNQDPSDEPAALSV